MSELEAEIHGYFQHRIRQAHPRVTQVLRYSLPHCFGVDCYDADGQHLGWQFHRGYWDTRVDALTGERVDERQRLYLLCDLLFHEVHEKLKAAEW